ncbi:FtsH protease activity modulator HflK [Paracoccus sp. (in: a-proteobacteria)]|uniref:FtsH protease activity modulator HflK n=1 Tax=Paracoccus sp. TaxID=267 RepID=UPI0026E0A973|nr:FtsH protease activity modulator HflK [Paracoccus sp. (in: a-proteobacteria)]MDO5370918.1 FtsH protease activity modulator HflK [Paracoccus sp. (in: a-proteobacteria)]
MAQQGPWGGGNGGGDDDRPARPQAPKPDRGGPQRPWGQPGPDQQPPNGGKRPEQIPEIEELMRKGQDRLRVLMGGRDGTPRTGGPRGPRRQLPSMDRGKWGIAALVAVALWGFASIYQVDTSEKSVELLFGRPYAVRDDGLNFAPWPFVTYQIVGVTRERTIDIGTGRDPMDSGLMLTRDQNIVDLTYQVVWNVSNPEQYLFNLADPEGTIRAVAESAMRDIVARSELSPILNRDRGVIARDLELAIQATLDSYQAGINVVRVNLGRADPPAEVIDSFREVQAAQQERDRLEKEADAYANRVLAAARGEAAALVEQSEAYRAQAVNAAQGEAARFTSVYDEYVKAPEVTRRRMYLETMERVLGNVDKVLIDGEAGQGVVPYLPLDQLRSGPPPAARSGTSDVNAANSGAASNTTIATAPTGGN